MASWSSISLMIIPGMRSVSTIGLVLHKIKPLRSNVFEFTGGRSGFQFTWCRGDSAIGENKAKIKIQMTKLKCHKALVYWCYGEMCPVELCQPPGRRPRDSYTPYPKSTVLSLEDFFFFWNPVQVCFGLSPFTTVLLWKKWDNNVPGHWIGACKAWTTCSFSR